jgi:hypothetical protein
VRSALQVPGEEHRRRTGTVLALREDPVRARLWERDVETVAMAPTTASPAAAARRLEVLLDLIGCVSTPPTGYLLDPAYRGLLDEQERALADALVPVARTVPEEPDSSAASEVAALLRRLGWGNSAAESDEAPADEPTSPRDDRRQEQRPG